jgi:hypothetical protein
MKSIKYNIMALLAISLSLTSCLKDKGYDDLDYGLDTDGKNLKPSVKILEGGTASNEIKKLIFADGTAALDSLEFTLAYVDYKNTSAPSDLTITLGADPAYVATFNTGNPVQYELMPDSLFSLPKTSVVIKAGTSFSEMVKIYFRPNKFDGARTYLLPIKILSTSGIADVEVQGNYGRISFTKIGNILAGKYSNRYRRWQSYDTTTAPLQDITSTVIVPPVSPTEIMTTETYTTTFVDPAGGIVMGFTNTGGVPSAFNLSLTSATLAGIPVGGFTLITAPKFTGNGVVTVVGNVASNFIGTRFSTFIQYQNSTPAGRSLVNDFVKVP